MTAHFDNFKVKFCMENLDQIEKFFDGFYYLTAIVSVLTQSVTLSFQNESLEKMHAFFSLKVHKSE